MLHVTLKGLKQATIKTELTAILVFKTPQASSKPDILASMLARLEVYRASALRDMTVGRKKLPDRWARSSLPLHCIAQWWKNRLCVLDRHYAGRTVPPLYCAMGEKKRLDI